MAETEVEPPARPAASGDGFWRFIAEMLKTVVIISLLAFVIRQYLLQPFVVEGSSMAPEFASNDYLLVNKISYRFEAPARGDIVVFRYPKNTAVNYVKRIIGLPGEEIRIEQGRVFVINADHPDGMLLDEPYLSDGTETLPTEVGQARFKVDQGSYFVLGDNRPGSSDSREWGLVPKSDLIGRVVVQAFPVNRAKLISDPSY